MKKQGYNSRMDESLGMRNGRESGMKQSYKDRRDESRGVQKPEVGRASPEGSFMGQYKRVQPIDYGPGNRKGYSPMAWDYHY